MRENGFIATKGDSRSIDPMKASLEEHLGKKLEVVAEDDFTVVSNSEDMRQDGLLIGFNGYLEEKGGVPEQEIAEAYREHKDDFPKYLNGSFRTVVYDIERQSLIVTADKIGRKVIYYSDRDNFICTSHLKPLLAHPQIDRQLDKEGVSEFLQSWSVSFSGGSRLIESVKRLQPSTRIVYTQGETHKKRFWDVYDSKRNVSDSEAVKQMDHLLREATENLVERVDGEINVFLSGGFDSVFLTKLISDATEREINTYTWGWKDKHFTDAEKMSERLGTNQHSLRLDFGLPTKEDLRYYEEPHNAFVRYPFRELYQNHGLRSYWTGLNSQATFPVCLKNVRKLDKVRKLKPVVEIARKARFQKMASKANYRLGKGLEVLGDQHHSAGIVNDWGLRNDQARNIMSPELRNSTRDVRKKLDERWNLEKKSHQENYSYMQLRARDTARYAYYAQNMEHIDVYGYTPLLEYSYSLPMNQKKNRRLLQKIAKGRVPDEIITKGASGWEFVSEQFKRKITRNREEYEKTIESFLERGFLEIKQGRKLLLRRNYSLTKGPINYMISVYLLEKWIQEFIEK